MEKAYKATKEEWFKMLDDGFVSHKEGNVVFFQQLYLMLSVCAVLNNTNQ